MVLAGALAAAPARAQVCTGLASQRDGRFRLAAGSASYSHAGTVSLSFTTGRAVYADLGVGRTRDAELDATAYDFRSAFRSDLPIVSSRLFLCPVAAVSLSLGPYDFLLDADYRRLEAAAGAGFAAVPVRSPALSVVAGASVRAVRLTTKLRRGPERHVRRLTEVDVYYLADLGVALIIGDRFAVRAGVTVPFDLVPPGDWDSFAVPFGREEGEVSPGISFAVSFGRGSQRSR